MAASLKATPAIVLRVLASAALTTALVFGSLKLFYIDHAAIALMIVALVVALAVLRGTIEGLAAAVSGGLGYDYFYLPPSGFGVEKPEHAITLAVFLFVAVSVGQLASRLKRTLDQKGSLTHLSPEPLCITDLEGRLQSINQALANLLGWKETGLQSKPFLDFVHSADRERTEAAFRQAIQGHATVEVETRCHAADGSWRWLRWRIAPPAADASWLSAAARDITEEKWAQEKLRDLADQVMSAQEEERRRIARELHDDVTQRLAALGIELGLLKQEQSINADELHEDLTRLQGGVLRLTEDVRTLSHSLHPSILEHSTLAASLEMYCREFSQQHGIPVAFIAHGNSESLPRAVTVALYRITQEALRNVALHSAATEATVVLDPHSLSVIDNGKGFDPATARTRPGLGLVSIEERARQIEASVTIDSVPDEGVRLTVQLPGVKEIAS